MTYARTHLKTVDPDKGRKALHSPAISSSTRRSADISAALQRRPLCPCEGSCPRCLPQIQAKLTIGQPGDKYEQEADRLADEIMRMPEPDLQLKAG